jgi:hypothetical protein
MVELTSFAQQSIEGTKELELVRKIADDLLTHLNTPDAQSQLAAANLPGRSSALVQATFTTYAREVGFADESKGLFASYPTSGLRPDYFLSRDGVGILLEVERGKTTINNMDLLDFWKCHLCEHAQYLFLLVPRALRQNETAAVRHEYATVAKRMHSFFVPRNYTNVRGLFIFGY